MGADASGGGRGGVGLEQVELLGAGAAVAQGVSD